MARKKYISVTEVDLSDVELRLPAAFDPDRFAFFEEVALRLEQTAKGMALQYLFRDKKIANAYRNYTMSRAVKHLGRGAIRSQILPAEGKQCYLYLFHGPNWTGEKL